MSTEDPAELYKRQAALRALDEVRDGMVLGLGSGSTANHFVRALGQRVSDGLQIVGVPSSRRTERLAREVGVPLTSLDAHEALDLTIDGADQVVLPSLELLKGGGGALLREKLVARASARLVIIVDQSKLVDRLGGLRAIPVEVIRFGWHQTARALEDLGCQPRLRVAGDGPFVSDEGHHVLDCEFPPLDQPAAIARAIKALTGVVDHGLFVDLADLVVVGGDDGVRCFERPARAP